MANTKNILVPFGKRNSDLKSLYHAFGLAKRIKAKIFVLLFKEENFTPEQITPLEKACLEMARSACEDGIAVSFHIADRRFGVELLNIIKIEHIDLIVIGAVDTEIESAIKGLQLGGSIQVIKVKEKS